MDSLEPSSYRYMWLIAMFDLPVVESRNRKAAARFRKKLIQSGFMMMQFSVYARFFDNEDASDVYARRIKSWLPPMGDVRIILITDRQFSKMKIYRKREELPAEETQPLLLLM